MEKYDIWMSGYWYTGMEEQTAKAQLLASGVEGETFIDAVQKWYTNTPDSNKYGELTIDNGIPKLWGISLHDNEEDARTVFG